MFVLALWAHSVDAHHLDLPRQDNYSKSCTYSVIAGIHEEVSLIKANENEKYEIIKF